MRDVVAARRAACLVIRRVLAGEVCASAPDEVSTVVGGVSTVVSEVSTVVCGVSTVVGGVSTVVGGVSMTVGGVSTTVGGVSTTVGGVSTTVDGVSVEERVRAPPAVGTGNVALRVRLRVWGARESTMVGASAVSGADEGSLRAVGEGCSEEEPWIYYVRTGVSHQHKS